MISKFPKKAGDMNGLIRKIPTQFSIHASSIETGTTKYPENMINFEEDHWWCSNNHEYESISLSFNNLIYVTNYSFQVKAWENGRDYPMHWYMKGINEKGEFLASNITSSGLNPSTLINTYSTTNIGPFHEINITHYGYNYRGLFHFCLYKIEIFGFIYKGRYCRTTQRIFTIQHPLLFMISLISS